MLEKIKGKYPIYALTFFAFYFAFGMFSSILSIYLSGIGKSGAELSLIISASSLFSIIMLPIGGYLSDYFGKPKQVAAMFLIFAAIMGIVFGISQQTWLLYILNGFIIASINCVMPIYEKAASRSKYRYGLIRVWGAVGYAVAAQTAGFVYEHISAFSIYIIFSIAAIISIVAMYAMNDLSATASEGKKEKIKLPWKNRELWIFLILAFVFAGSTGVSSTYLPVLFIQMGRTTTEAGTLLFLATLMEVPLILYSHRFMDRFAGKTLLVANFIIIAIQFGIYGFAQSSIAIILAAVLLKSLATMLFIMVTLKVVVTVVNENIVTTALSVTGTFKYLGAMLFQNIGGNLVDNIGISALYRVLTATAIAGVFVAAFMRMENRDGIFTVQPEKESA